MDVRMACCVLHRKRLIAAVRPLSSGEKLEFIAENTEAVKKQVQKVLEVENCRIVEVNDENGTSRMIVQKT